MNGIKILFFLVACLLSLSLVGQVGGVHAGKINAINHAPIAVGTAEFEPNYSYTSFSKFWDNDGQLKDLFAGSDSTEIQTSVSFRLAYACSERLEVGAFIANDFSNWSFKYATHTLDKLGLGVFGGINLPFGNTVKNNSNKTPDQIAAYIVGIASSYQFTDLFSVDANVQLQNYFSSHPELPINDWIFYIDGGKYIGDSEIMLMSSISYQRSKFEDFNQTKLSYYPGIAFEMKSNYFIVINGMFDVSGKNSEKTRGIAFSWTITL